VATGRRPGIGRLGPVEVRSFSKEYGSLPVDKTAPQERMDSTGATIPFSSRARVAEGVLFRELEGESVILSLDSETYYGLDEVGTRIWSVLAESPTIQAAFERLCQEYEVESDRLRHDLEELLGELVGRKLIEIHAP
jgi:hypothetical protein